ncbi:NADH dehydrogenase subunit M [Chitinophaga costaii]|uniref:NADH dehydrogenase subunit M n=1 Tax=Chitinophaga costaii TaxID=1335309 RepID=A0A1C4BSE2_9BACT|nr:NADH-quinone oxidoreductase subunit M [Chitinophaga costaii]PUZ27497.1 NADH-quinone oxidoreductase subunit M [Chitinophaga costaii]SCC09648.1 NADH dehydrogenase subunit M [Chitinophaga costaii]
MLTVLLILIPLLAGFISFGLKGTGPKVLALLSSIATLGVSLVALFQFKVHPEATRFTAQWIPQLNAKFAVGLDGMGAMLCLLTTIAFVLVFISIFSRTYERSNSFYGLLLLAQAGLTGVFTAYDALLFYVGWELALVPMYFLCSIWGGEKRIPVTFKFFIYTFVGSLFMLIGIIYLYLHTKDASFSYNAFVSAGASLQHGEQSWLFWLFFVAFAIKMPIFPLHTWQPDTYEQSPTPVTMILSGVMVKMGLFGALRWLLPVLPGASASWSDLVIVLSIIGIVYASCIAIVQSDLKKMIAYSSIAHIGLMSAAIFAHNQLSLQGVLVQMFNHGINIIGLWIIVDVIEQRLGGVKNMKELGGIASKAPRLAIFLVIISLANVGLPLTNGFIGEFLMFSGLFQVNVWFMAVAGLGIILSAVYILNMIQRVIFGESNAVTAKITDLTPGETLSLTLIVLLIFVVGVYPKPMLELVSGTTQLLQVAFQGSISLK